MSYGQNPYGQPGPPYGQPVQQPGWNPAPQQPGYPPQPPQGWAPQQPPNQPGWPAAPGGHQGQQPAPQGPPGQPQGWPQSAVQPSAPTGEVPAQPVPPTPVPEPEPRQAAFAPSALPVSTTESVAGHEVTALLGAVVGVITQPRDLKPGPELSVVLTEIRQDAVHAMVAMAVEVGADAVVGLHFDTGPISGATSEVVAYGTAVMLDGNKPASEIDAEVEAIDEAVAAAEIEAEVEAAAEDAVESETDTVITAAVEVDDPRLTESSSDSPSPKRASRSRAKASD